MYLRSTATGWHSLAISYAHLRSTGARLAESPSFDIAFRTHPDESQFSARRERKRVVQDGRTPPSAHGTTKRDEIVRRERKASPSKIGIVGKSKETATDKPKRNAPFRSQTNETDEKSQDVQRKRGPQHRGTYPHPLTERRNGTKSQDVSAKATNLIKTEPAIPSSNAEETVPRHTGPRASIGCAKSPMRQPRHNQPFKPRREHFYQETGVCNATG